MGTSVHGEKSQASAVAAPWWVEMDVYLLAILESEGRPNMFVVLDNGVRACSSYLGRQLLWEALRLGGEAGQVLDVRASCRGIPGEILEFVIDRNEHVQVGAGEVFRPCVCA